MAQWEKKIKDSADAVEIPEALQPDRVGRKLEKKASRQHFYKKPVFQVSFAAAIMLLVFGGWFGSRLGRNMNGTEKTAEDVAETTEKISLGIQEEELKALDSYYHTETYEEIETQLQKIRKNGSYNHLENADGAVVDDEIKEESFAGESIKEQDTENYSQTNLQVKGVDEADVVKTDGTYLYIMNFQGWVWIVHAAKMETVSCLRLTGAAEYKEIYVDEDRLIALGNRTFSSIEEPSDGMYATEEKTETVMVTYDISKPEKPELKGMFCQDGFYRTSRKVGDFVYLFSDYSCGSEGNTSLIPLVNGERIPEDCIYVPQQVESCQYLVMSVISMENPEEATEKKCLLDSGDQFYITRESIYVIRENWYDGSPDTEIVRFCLENHTIRGKGVINLNGRLTDTFAVNEYQGYLRILLTDINRRGIEENKVYVLDQNLDIVGELEGIASGETIYSARFMGEMGYFVTYRNTDPLFSLDCSDPENPKIIGERKMTGFSDYLHFYGKENLLGLGWETDPNTGERQGLKISMFQISDGEHIREEHKLILGDVSDCFGLEEYKQILVDYEANLIGFSVQSVYDGNVQQRYLVYSYEKEQGFVKKLDREVEEGSAGYDSGAVRGLYIGESFYLVEDKKITSFDRKNRFVETGSLELTGKS